MSLGWSVVRRPPPPPAKAREDQGAEHQQAGPAGELDDDRELNGAPIERGKTRFGLWYAPDGVTIVRKCSSQAHSSYQRRCRHQSLLCNHSSACQRSPSAKRLLRRQKLCWFAWPSPCRSTPRSLDNGQWGGSACRGSGRPGNRNRGTACGGPRPTRTGKPGSWNSRPPQSSAFASDMVGAPKCRETSFRGAMLLQPCADRRPC